MKLLDLPCVLEIQKTTDKTTFYKNGDIGQMIHISEQETIDSKLLDGEYRLASGLTPPTFEVRKRKFNKRNIVRNLNFIFKFNSTENNIIILMKKPYVNY